MDYTVSNARDEQGTLLTVSQAADLLHVHPDTLRRWAAKGLLRSYRVGPRRDRRFRSLEVINLLTQG
ncbi:MAG: helix-turn-helix domain-containing protein [Acidobacteria bacterium]|nr:helix-turn-helix domain-containing protein [Acidobacteriota bacterium]